MAEEVGVAYVSLLPSLRGFSKLVQRQLNAEFRGNKAPTIRVRPTIDADTARAELTAELTGLSRRVTMQVAVDVDQQETVRRLNRSLVTVGNTVRSTQKLDVETDVDPIRLAQQARAAVSFAEATAGDIDVNTDVDPDRGRAAGRLLGNAIGEGVRSAGGVIQAGAAAPITGLASNPIIGTAGAAIGLAMGATLAPALGAAVSAALIGGAGLGVIGLGAFLLKDDPEVRKAAGELGHTAKQSFVGAAAPLQQPFVVALGILRDLVIELRPELTELFTAISPSVVPLTRGFAGLIREMMPGVLALVKAATPFLQDLEQTLPRLGSDIGTFFSIIAGGGPGATAFFRDLLHVLGIGLRVFAVLIRVLTGWYGATRTIVGAVISVWQFFHRLTGQIVESVVRFFIRLGRFIVAAFVAGLNEAGRFLNWIKGLPGWIKSAIGGLGTLLANAGKELIEGLIRGIKDKLGALGDVMGSVAQKVRDYWPFSPAKTGPLSGSGSMDHAGANVVTDLARGMQHELPVVESASAQLAGAIGTGRRGWDGAAMRPAGLEAGWRRGTTGDRLLDALREHIEFRFGGDPVTALGSR